MNLQINIQQIRKKLKAPLLSQQWKRFKIMKEEKTLLFRQSNKLYHKLNQIKSKKI